MTNWDVLLLETHFPINIPAVIIRQLTLRDGSWCESFRCWHIICYFSPTLSTPPSFLECKRWEEDASRSGRRGAWGAVLGTAVAVAVVGLVAYVILKRKHQKGFSHSKLVEEHPSDPGVSWLAPHVLSPNGIWKESYYWEGSETRPDWDSKYVHTVK